MPANTALGAIVSLWRYPVKSMIGEELNAAELDEVGLVGDRAYALVDSLDGKVASAKNPRKWPDLFQFRASFINPPRAGGEISAVRVIFPDGSSATSEQADVSKILSGALSREVTFTAANRERRKTVSASPPDALQAEEYWPDIEGLDHRDTVTDFALPEGTFFDTAVVHLLTTATLDRLRTLYPQGRFEARRFRPNIVVETADGEKDFVENAWIGQVVAIGDEVRLTVTGACPRCVMTTLRQGDLPKDVGILRAAAQNNGANVEVYASVLRGGKSPPRRFRQTGMKSRRPLSRPSEDGVSARHSGSGLLWFSDEAVTTGRPPMLIRRGGQGPVNRLMRMTSWPAESAPTVSRRNLSASSSVTSSPASYTMIGARALSVASRRSSLASMLPIVGLLAPSMMAAAFGASASRCRDLQLLQSLFVVAELDCLSLGLDDGAEVVGVGRQDLAGGGGLQDRGDGLDDTFRGRGVRQFDLDGGAQAGSCRRRGRGSCRAR